MFFVMMLEGFVLVILVNFVFLLLSMSEDSDANMISPYECGFDPMVGSRMKFSYRFFLISILFLVFDVEITLLIPLPYITMGVGVINGLMCFMLLLLGGLVYEYYNGVLSWI